MSVTSETHQLAMGPYLSMADSAFELNCVTAVFREALLGKVWVQAWLGEGDGGDGSGGDGGGAGGGGSGGVGGGGVGGRGGSGEGDKSGGDGQIPGPQLETS